jgi:hypothetical protein
MQASLRATAGGRRSSSRASSQSAGSRQVSRDRKRKAGAVAPLSSPSPEPPGISEFTSSDGRSSDPCSRLRPPYERTTSTPTSGRMIVVPAASICNPDHVRAKERCISRESVGAEPVERQPLIMCAEFSGNGRGRGCGCARATRPALRPRASVGILSPTPGCAPPCRDRSCPGGRAWSCSLP